MDKLKYYKVCRIRCLHCGDVLKHVNQTKEENSAQMMYCSCRRIGLDPSATLYRVVTTFGAKFEDLSEEWKDGEEK